jgi:hypothetical protein
VHSAATRSWSCSSLSPSEFRFFIEGARFRRSGLFPRPWRRWPCSSSRNRAAVFSFPIDFTAGAPPRAKVLRRRGVFVSFLATAAVGPDSSLLRSARGEQPPPCPGFSLTHQVSAPPAASLVLLRAGSAARLPGPDFFRKRRLVPPSCCDSVPCVF